MGARYALTLSFLQNAMDGHSGFLCAKCKAQTARAGSFCIQVNLY